ncbi:MAG: endonuclease III [bacterium]|nr:endonuclease III [bacterium]
MTDLRRIIKLLRDDYPDPKIALTFSSTFQLLVAVILSAQCTDVRVNKVTPALFKKLPGALEFSRVKIEDLEKMIFSTGFYRAKAKNIKGAAEMIVREFGGNVPDNMDDLLKLPGVARKTANVIMSAGFGRTEGITVDTHVCRLAGRLGLVPMKMSKAKNAVGIENALMKMVPKKDWSAFPHLLILHGRNICIARKPKCKECSLNKICPSADLG